MHDKENTSFQWSILLTLTDVYLCVLCMFTTEFGSGPFRVDHSPAVHPVYGSSVGADRCEQLLHAGSSDSAGNRPGLAHTEDGTTSVGKHIHSFLLL